MGLVVGAGLDAAAGRLHYRMQSVAYVGEEEVGRESLHTELTVAGTLLGAVVGVMLPGEQWTRAWLGDLATVGASAGAGGTALAGRVRF